MALVKEILSAATAHRRRGLKDQTLRKADMLVAAWLFAAIFIRFSVNCVFAVRTLSHPDSRAAGLVIAQLTMLHLFVLAFLLSFLLASLSFGSAGLNRRRLGASPAPFSALLLSELQGLVLGIPGWMVLPFFAPAVLVPVFLSRPAPAVVTLLAGFVMASGAGWALSVVLSGSRHTAGFSRALRIVSAAAMLGLVAANIQYVWKGREVTLLVFGHAFAPTVASALIGPGTPAGWVMAAGTASGAAAWPWVLMAATCAAAVLCLGALALRRAFYSPAPGPGSAPRSIRRWRFLDARGGTLGVLWRKEVLYLASSAGSLLSFLAGTGSAVWLLVTPHPVAGIALLGAGLSVAAGFSYASNLFGHDGAAVRRYVLAATDWRTLFMAKNLAYLAGMAVPSALLLFAAVLRIPRYAAAVAVSLAVVLVLAMVWGNLASILLPSTTRRGEMHGETRGGSFVNQVFPIAVWGVPLALHRAAAPFGTPAFSLAMLGCLILAAVAYAALIRRITLRFPSEVEDFMKRF